MRHFRKRRAFLLGEAAHIHTCRWAANEYRIGEAINLARKLKAVLRQLPAYCAHRSGRNSDKWRQGWKHPSGGRLPWAVADGTDDCESLAFRDGTVSPARQASAYQGTISSGTAAPSASARKSSSSSARSRQGRSHYDCIKVTHTFVGVSSVGKCVRSASALEAFDHRQAVMARYSQLVPGCAALRSGASCCPS
jgi:hypothetical protein